MATEKFDFELDAWVPIDDYVDKNRVPRKTGGVNFNIGNLTAEREGIDATGGMGNREYVRRMYAKRRADGLSDPVPENSQSARYAPAAGVLRDKKYKEANNGL